MSDKERAEIKKEIASAIIKQWWPVVAGFFSAIVFAIGITWWVATNIATTKDIDKLNVKVDTLTNKTASLNDSFNNHVKTGNITKVQLITSKDSLAKVTSNIEKRMGTRYASVTQHKDKYGNITYIPLN